MARIGPAFTQAELNHSRRRTMASNSGGSRIAAHTDGPLVGVARSAESQVRAGMEKVSEATEASREYIRENPMKTVLIAAGVGALVGFLIGRRR
jgi:ElaB/YqjD/DUF883 family membrane-anchored ribosome-binding protein